LEEGEDIMSGFAKLWQKTARKKNRRFLRDAEVNRLGKYIKNFFLAEQAQREKNGVRVAHEVATTQGGWRALVDGGPLVSLPCCFLFSYFSKNTKTDRK
jgi:hypothetical protein